MISAELRKKDKWSSIKISLFVEISRLTIEYTAWNLRRCNIFFTVWWSTYRKINVCARSQNDNMRYSDLTIVSVSLIINLNSTNVDLEWRFIFRLDDRRWQSRDSNLRLSNERRKRENDINSHNSHTLFYQPFPVLQMLITIKVIVFAWAKNDAEEKKKNFFYKMINFYFLNDEENA
jgi:hypothetical protein